MAEDINFITSDKVAEKITEIAQKNGIEDETKIEGIGFRSGLVFSGRLPKENLALTFELGLKIPAETSKKIADEINQFLANANIKLETEPEPTVNEPPKKPASEDSYREPVA